MKKYKINDIVKLTRRPYFAGPIKAIQTALFGGEMYQIERTIAGRKYLSAPYLSKDLIPHDPETTEDEKPEAVAVKRRFFGMLKYYSDKNGCKEGWDVLRFCERFLSHPGALRNALTIRPDAEFKEYIKTLNRKGE